MAYYRPQSKDKKPIDPWKKVCLWIAGVWIGLFLLGGLVMGDRDPGIVTFKNRSNRQVVVTAKVDQSNVLVKVGPRDSCEIDFLHDAVEGQMFSVIDAETGKKLATYSFDRELADGLYRSFKYPK